MTVTSILASSEVDEFAPRIHQLMMDEIDSNNYSNVLNVAAEMFFIHGRREFHRFILDDRAMTNSPGHALSAADQAHTREARQFLEDIAQRHKDENMRNRALEILEAW